MSIFSRGVSATGSKQSLLWIAVIFFSPSSRSYVEVASNFSWVRRAISWFSALHWFIIFCVGHFEGSTFILFNVNLELALDPRMASATSGIRRLLCLKGTIIVSHSRTMFRNRTRLSLARISWALVLHLAHGVTQSKTSLAHAHIFGRLDY